jgi:hypothetical protein
MNYLSLKLSPNWVVQDKSRGEQPTTAQSKHPHYTKPLEVRPSSQKWLVTEV